MRGKCEEQARKKRGKSEGKAANEGTSETPKQYRVGTIEIFLRLHENTRVKVNDAHTRQKQTPFFHGYTVLRRGNGFSSA